MDHDSTPQGCNRTVTNALDRRRLLSLITVSTTLGIAGCAGSESSEDGPAAGSAGEKEPAHEVMRDVMIEMRDGGKLATDVHLSDEEGPFPTLVNRTPYNKAEDQPCGGTVGGIVAAVENGTPSSTKIREDGSPRKGRGNPTSTTKTTGTTRSSGPPSRNGALAMSECTGRRTRERPRGRRLLRTRHRSSRPHR